VFKEQRNSQFVLVALMVALSPILGGCGPKLTPTPLPAPTLMPLTSTPAPTQTPIPSATPTSPAPTPALTLERQPTVEVVKVGQDVAIVVKIEPLQEIHLRWRVTGTSGGKVYPAAGDAVIYTAGQPGTDVVTAEGTAAGGAPIKQSTSFTVEPLPITRTSTITLSPTLTPTSTPQTPTPYTITLTSLKDGQSVPCENLAKGTYPLDLKDRIWPVVYIGGRLHLQDDAGAMPPMVNGNWYATVRFGNCNKPEDERGKAFQLIIVTANDAANKAFEDYIAKGQATGLWPGMVSLPEGAKEHLRIAVIRQ